MVVLLIFSNTKNYPDIDEPAKVILVDMQGKSTDVYKELKNKFKKNSIHMRLYTKLGDEDTINLFLPIARLFKESEKDVVDVYYKDRVVRSW